MFSRYHRPPVSETTQERTQPQVPQRLPFSRTGIGVGGNQFAAHPPGRRKRTGTARTRGLPRPPGRLVAIAAVHLHADPPVQGKAGDAPQHPAPRLALHRPDRALHPGLLFLRRPAGVQLQPVGHAIRQPRPADPVGLPPHLPGAAPHLHPALLPPARPLLPDARHPHRNCAG